MGDSYSLVDAEVSNMLGSEALLRLECARLAANRDLDGEDVAKNAAALYRFVANYGK